jgi:[ribosomal protein S18]-alanine N-acetyltransferase
LTFAIRPIAAPDLNAIHQLAANAREAPQWNRAAYENLFAPGIVRHFAYLADDGHALWGFAIATWLPSEEAAELETVVVDAPYRRHGAGGALLHACMLAAARAGASSMRLEVRESNNGALALYQRNGFSSAGRRRAYYSAPVEDAILLQAPLGAFRLQSPL